MEHRIAHTAENGPALIVTADDYGYAPGFDRGILEAALAGAVDAVSAMVGEGSAADPAPLLASGVEVGLHLQAAGAAAQQVASFEALFGRPPAYLDGHRHGHAAGERADEVARVAADLGVPVRSVDAAHRRLLRRHGVPTPDRLIGRLHESEPALPSEIQAVLEGGPPPPGVTEWMTHPGRREVSSGSRYDAGRREDLDLLLRLRGEPALASLRRTHGRALG